jgi:hypothetical protein
MKINQDGIRQHASAEVLELGEMLFDAAIDAALRRPVQSEGVGALLVEEMRSASEEFFVALRLLLGVEKQDNDGRYIGGVRDTSAPTVSSAD